MIRQMLNILVCPFDKESELELFEFSSRNLGENKIDLKLNNSKTIEPIEERQNLKHNIPENSNNNGKERDIDVDSTTVIEEGILFCNSCLRFYPIVEEIPIILPDNLRDKNKDLEILKKWEKSLPEKVIKEALPWHL